MCISTFITLITGNKTGDYHDDMNHVNFMQWVRKQLIPNLPKESALVIDNASYHNLQIDKGPTSCSKKQEMIRWLVERDSHLTTQSLTPLRRFGL